MTTKQKNKRKKGRELCVITTTSSVSVGASPCALTPALFHQPAWTARRGDPQVQALLYCLYFI